MTADRTAEESNLPRVQRRDDIEAFLAIFGTPTEAELLLWGAVLAPIDDLPGLFSAWLQSTEKKPHPHALLGYYAHRRAAGPMLHLAEKVAAEGGLTVAEILVQDRRRPVSLVRDRIMGELRQAGYSTPEIGRFLKRDHTTVMAGIARWASR